MAIVKTSDTDNLVQQLVEQFTGEVNYYWDGQDYVPYFEDSILNIGEGIVSDARELAQDALDRADGRATFTDKEEGESYDGGAYVDTVTKAATSITRVFTKADGPADPAVETESANEKLTLSGNQATGYTLTEKESSKEDYPGASNTYSEGETESATFSSFDVTQGDGAALTMTKINESETWSDSGTNHYGSGTNSGSFSMAFAGAANFDQGEWQASSVQINSLSYKDSSKYQYSDIGYGVGSSSEALAVALTSKAGFTVNDDFSLSGQIDSLSYSSKETWFAPGQGSSGGYTYADYTSSSEDSFMSTAALTGATITALQTALQAETDNLAEGTDPGDYIDALRQALLSGNDTIAVTGDFGGFIEAGAGNDTVTGGKGDDYLDGEAGDDKLTGNAGSDDLYGGDGKDTLSGGEGADHLYGDAGNDTLTGDAGDDYMNGGDDDDTLDGGVGNDRLYGGSGVDKLTGGTGHDFVHGGAGNDTLTGGEGNDYLVGAEGKDTLDGGNGNDQIYGDSNTTTDDGTDHSDVMLGGAGDDYMAGGYGNDSLDGGAGDDRLYGNAGNDKLLGGAGIDTINGGAGDDILDGGAGNDVLVGGTGADALTGGAGKDGFSFGYSDGTYEGALAVDKITDFKIKEDWINFDDIAVSLARHSYGTGEQLATYDALLTAAETKFAEAGTNVNVYVAAAEGNKTYVFADQDGDNSADIAIELIGVYGTAAASIQMSQYGNWVPYDTPQPTFDDYYYA